MRNDSSRPTSTSTSTRVVDLIVGIAFTASAVAIVVWADQSTLAGSIVAALVVGGLGIEAISSAARGKRSLLARIGPLP